MPTDAQLRLEGAYKVVEWMRVREKALPAGGGYDAEGLKLELDHSALIHWLCAGNAPLPERPPVRLSRPDHEAAVTGRFEPFHVSPARADRHMLIVDQEAWQVIEALGPQEWVAAHRLDGRPECLSWSPPWLIRRNGEGWLAERLPLPQTSAE